MDFQSFVNTFSLPCAVLAVKKSDTGYYDDIRIISSNDGYKQTIDPNIYHDGIHYTELMPREMRFEDFCYRAAILKQKMQAYVETRAFDVWTDFTILPLAGGTEEVGYCAFTLQTSQGLVPESMSHVHPETAAFVIKNSIILRNNPDFNAGVEAVVSDIQKRTEAFSSWIILRDDINKTYSVLCAKFNDDSIDYKRFSSKITYSIVKSWEKSIGTSNCVIIKDEHDLAVVRESNPEWADSLVAGEVKSLILYPLMQGTKQFGYLFITNFNTQNLVTLKETIELTAFFLSTEMTSHMLLEKLEYMSSVDFLTGIKNRNAMNNRVDGFVSGEKTIPSPFGVVFADLNGLKTMNDANGHEAGDELIKKGAQVLKEAFPTAEWYRAGGDEFVVIVPACQKDEFEKSVSDLKLHTGVNSDVCLAVGAYWNSDGKDLRLSMHLADEAMYQDKDRFYREHAERKRRE